MAEKEIDTVTVNELPSLALKLENLFAHSDTLGNLYKGTLGELAAFIAPYIQGVASSGFVAISGFTLPSSPPNSYSIVGAGDYGTIVLTAPLNVISNGANNTWDLVKAINLDLTNYVSFADLYSYGPLDIPFEYSLRLNQIYNGDGSSAASDNWDSALVKISKGQKISVNNVSGIPITYLVFLKGSPTNPSNVLEFRGDGTTPITGEVKIPEGTTSIAVDFLKMGATTTKQTYQGSSFMTVLSNETSQDVGLPIILDNIVFNSVANPGGSITSNTNNWDYAQVEVKEGANYDVVGIPIFRYIVFYKALPFIESNLVTAYTYNDTQTGRNFTAPVGAKYAAIDILKSGAATTVATYKNAYIFETSLLKKSIFQHANNKISMFGNSFFQGNYALDEDSIQLFLAPKMPNFNIINCGAGGETSLQILGRQGAIPMYLKNSVTIPALSSARVLIGNRLTSSGIYSVDGYENDSIPLPQAVTPPTRDTSYMNPVLIEGIECIYSWDQGTENQYIQRVTSASQSYTTRPKAIIGTRAMRELRNSWCNIFFLLTNDPFTNVSDMLRKYDKAIEYSGHSRFVVMSEWSDERLTLEQMVSLENEMLKRYGARFFNLRKFAIERAMPLLGLTPSTSDQERMNNGLIPIALTIDRLHPTTPMYGLIAEQFYQIMLQTGVINP